MGTGLSAFPNFTLDPVSGAPLIQFTRIWIDDDKNMALRLVAEADGPVRNAILQTTLQDTSCQFYEHGLDGERLVFEAITRTGDYVDGGKEREVGAIGALIGTHEPDVVHRIDDIDSFWSPHWYISEQWLVGLEIDKQRAWSWDLQQQYTVYSPSQDPDSLPPHEAQAVGSDVFSHVSTLAHCGVMSWNVEHGSRPLLRWYGDMTRGAGNFGTDGDDMVWTYAEGSDACTTDANGEVWTASYATDPAVVEATAHRVRSDVAGMSTNHYVVGFGYAMRATGGIGAPYYTALYVVRLEDGMGWLVPGTEDPDVLGWSRVLGFTKDELFVTAAMRTDELDSSPTIVRIRLDSLGPGLPAD